MRVAVMASGRGSNFDALLHSSRSADHPAEIVLVISDHAEAPVLKKASDAGVATRVLDIATPRGDWNPEAIELLLATLRAAAVEAVCLAGFMRILPKEIVHAFPNRILNIHPSLLPSFPGTRPQRKALRAGVKVSGCTVHFVDDGVDTGPILLQAPVPVRPGDTEETLAARILEREHEIYPEALRLVAQDRVRVEGRVATVLDPNHVGEA